MFSQWCVTNSVHGAGGCVAGRRVWRGRCAWQRGGVRGRRDGHCSGRHASYWNAFLFLPPATKLGQGYIFTGVCPVNGGGCYPSMHCRWYPSMPCMSRGRGVAFCYGLLLWSSVMPFWFGGLLVWSSGGQKAITEGHRTRRP